MGGVAVILVLLAGFGVRSIIEVVALPFIVLGFLLRLAARK